MKTSQCIPLLCMLKNLKIKKQAKKAQVSYVVTNTIHIACPKYDLTQLGISKAFFQPSTNLSFHYANLN